MSGSVIDKRGRRQKISGETRGKYLDYLLHRHLHVAATISVKTNEKFESPLPPFQ